MNPEEKVEQKENPEKKEGLKSLRTYEGDVQEIMAKNKTSISSIVAAEQNRRDRTMINTEGEIENRAKNKFYILAGSLLLILGLITLGAVYYIHSNNTKETTVKKNKTIISFAQESVVPVTNSTREQMLNTIIREKKSFTMPVNSVLYLNTSDQLHTPANIESVFTLLAPRIPPTLARSFGSQYMIGIYSFDTNEPFILLTTDDYGNSYAGMLKWEPDIVRDIGVLFGARTENGTSTPNFQDRSLKNRDLRIFKNDSGKTTLLYSFIDKHTLVITTNENIFSAILSKYLLSTQTR